MITPDLGFWLRPLALVSMEVAAVFMAAFLAQTFVRSTFWRKAIWQICVAGSLLVVAMEVTGFGKGVALWVAHEKPQQRQVIARVLPGPNIRPLPQQAESEVEVPVTADVGQSPEVKSVWWPALIVIGGAATVLLRVIFARVALFLLCQKSQPPSSQLSERVAAIALRFRFSRKIRLILSGSVKSPIAFGVMRPSLGLPMNFEERFTTAQQDVMLVHEIAHLAGRDPLWYFAADVASAFLWWHPLIWIARRQLHVASELAADEATSSLQDGPATLAECLVNFGRQFVDESSFGWLGVRGSFRSALGQRVERLLTLTEPPSPPRWWTVLLAKTGFTVLLAGIIAFGFGAVQTSGAAHNSDLQTSLHQAWQESLVVKAVTTSSSESSTDDGTSSGSKNEASAAAPATELIELGEYERAKVKLPMLSGPVFANNASNYYLKLSNERRQFSEFSKNHQQGAKRSENNLYYLTNPKKVAAQLPAFTENPNHPSAPALGTDAGLNPAQAVLMADAKTGSNAPELAKKEVVKTPSIATNRADFTAKPVSAMSAGRFAILSKLQDIKLDELTFEKLPLSEVLKILTDEALRGDPGHAGVNFMINPAPLGAIPVTVVPPLKNISLGDVLAVIVKSVEKPIHYTIQDYAVVFAEGTGPAEQLYTRQFKVDPNAVTEALQKFQVTYTEPKPKTPALIGDFKEGRYNIVTKTNLLSANDALRSYFKVAGVELDPPKSVFFNDRTGMILVRATFAELETIRTAIQTLNSPTPQLTISVKFAEVDAATAKKLGLKWLVPTNVIQGSEIRKPADATVAIDKMEVPNAVMTNVSGILTDNEYTQLLRQLEKQQGVDLLTSPKVTTLSGRQAQVSILDLKTVVTGLETVKGSNGTSTNSLQTTQIPCGPVLDVIPYVSADGFFVQMTIIATINEFLGYDEPDKKLKAVSGNTTVPLPRLRVRQAMTAATVLDGQTIVLGGITSENAVKVKDRVPVVSRIPLLGRLFRSESATTEKRDLLVFVTPRLIDSAGNVVHQEEALDKLAQKMK